MSASVSRSVRITNQRGRRYSVPLARVRGAADCHESCQIMPCVRDLSCDCNGRCHARPRGRAAASRLLFASSDCSGEGPEPTLCTSRRPPRLRLRLRRGISGGDCEGVDVDVDKDVHREGKIMRAKRDRTLDCVADREREGYRAGRRPNLDGWIDGGERKHGANSSSAQGECVVDVGGSYSKMGRW